MSISVVSDPIFVCTDTLGVVYTCTDDAVGTLRGDRWKVLDAIELFMVLFLIAGSAIVSLGAHSYILTISHVQTSTLATSSSRALKAATHAVV